MPGTRTKTKFFLLCHTIVVASYLHFAYGYTEGGNITPSRFKSTVKLQHKTVLDSRVPTWSQTIHSSLVWLIKTLV